MSDIHLLQLFRLESYATKGNQKSVNSQQRSLLPIRAVREQEEISSDVIINLEGLSKTSSKKRDFQIYANVRK